MPPHKTTHLIGYASGLGAANPGCADGPPTLQKSPFLAELKNVLHWEAMLHPEKEQGGKLSEISKLCQQLATVVCNLAEKRAFFITLGGDHTSAVGTWSGAQQGLQGDLGLIWIDAHMDSHTHATTPSGNIHGMPLAALLGYGDPALTQILNTSPKLKPDNLFLIGIRSYESEEAALLKKLNVRVYFMEEIKQRGLAAVLAEALTLVKQKTKAYGLTIDIDSIDPIDAPGTGVPEPDGLSADELLTALQTVKQDPQLMGAEIVEFDPHRDHNHKTEKIAARLIEILGK